MKTMIIIECFAKRMPSHSLYHSAIVIVEDGQRIKQQTIERYREKREQAMQDALNCAQLIANELIDKGIDSNNSGFKK